MFDSLSEWFFTVQAWWEELTPDSQAFVRGAALLLVAFMVGEVVGRLVRHRLRAGGFDGSLRAPWLPAPAAGRAEGWPITPTGEVGLLTTRLRRQEGQVSRRNGLVLESHLQGASKSNGHGA